MKRVIAFIVAAGILVGGAVFFINNQNDWFQNVVEDAADKTGIEVK